jgi:hydroxymethylbilane synthase
MRTIRVGTRGSRLALKQTAMVKDELLSFNPALHIEVRVMKTTGDLLADAPLDSIGGKGVFVKDIERCLLDGEIDCAVHSLKDMQALMPDGLVISAYLKREDPRDMLFSRGRHTIETLPPGSKIGTSSIRRRCQLKLLRPDIEVVDIRGNVPTRLGKVGDTVDAVVLAAAGVRRLGLEEGVRIDTGSLIPFSRTGYYSQLRQEEDEWINALLKRIDHAPTRICAETERSFLAALGQDCNLPAGSPLHLQKRSHFHNRSARSPDESSIKRLSMEGSDPSIGKSRPLP